MVDSGRQRRREEIKDEREQRVGRKVTGSRKERGEMRKMMDI